jgi:YD repeat-containing protein
MVWQYGYDAMGRPTTMLDPNGLASYTYYDSLGRPIQTRPPTYDNVYFIAETFQGFLDCLQFHDPLAEVD